MNSGIGWSARFTRAVPRRRDRRELRRRLRSATRDVRAEQKHDVTLSLRRLVDRRVPLAVVRPAMTGCEVVEFTDGTHLEIELCEGETALERLHSRRLRQAYLSRVTPVVGRCWYRLQFSYGWAPSVEVLARVSRIDSAGLRFSRAEGRRGHRSQGEIGQAQP
ncbi:MAG: hypothetical protein ACRD0Z_13390 [Acidimicrobiales bacterium]